MKNLSTFLKESNTKSLEGYSPYKTSFGMHSVEEISDNGVHGLTQEGYHDHEKVKADAIKATQPLHDDLVKHYSNYTSNHVKNLKKYTTESGVLNNNLHGEATGFKPNGHPYSKELHEYHKPHIQHLDSAMRAHKTPNEMHVYSGTSFSPARYKSPDHKPGDPIKLHMPAYTSTSINHHEAEQFAQSDEHHEKHDRHLEDHDHMLKIHVPAGHHGAYVDHHSNNPGEREFILPRNTKLHVKDTPEVQYHSATGNPLAIWHATIHKD